MGLDMETDNGAMNMANKTPPRPEEIFYSDENPSWKRQILGFVLGCVLAVIGFVALAGSGVFVNA